MNDDLLRIDAARMHATLDALARIGATGDGGVRRLAFTPEDKAGRDFIEARMRALGLDVRIDGLGNLVGLRAGRADGPAVMTGSHLDTVATGGRYDGAFGVAAGLEVMATLADAGVVTRRPLALVAFANEEGARFQPALMGSQVFCGRLPLADARARTDAEGVTVADALDATGYAGPDDLRDLPLHAFVEMHVEQGPVLEAARVPVGVVTGVPGITWLRFDFRGETNHAGGTPMELRRDAGYAAACLARHVREVARALGGLQRATAGRLTFVPNLANVIPGEASVTVDLRNPDAGALREAEVRLRAFAEAVAAEEGVAVEVRTLVHAPPVAFDAALRAVIAEAAERLGCPAQALVSGGGHDAGIVADRCPSAMIFVPSVGGVSHSPAEYTRPEDLEAGANVLLHTLLALAETDDEAQKNSAPA